MAYPVPDDVSHVLALLKNSRELALHRQLRLLARDVATASRMLAKNSDLVDDFSSFDNLLEAIPGKMNESLGELYATVEAQIVSTSYARRSKRKINLLT